MGSPRAITKSKQLLVEGLDAERFFQVLLSRESVIDVQVQNFAGTDELRSFLRAFKIAPGFDAVVTSLGIARNAENDPRTAFQSVCGALRDASLPEPQQPGTFVGSKPQVAIFILPSSDKPGMLDTLCLDSVSGDSAMPCVENYINCLGKVFGRPLANPTKARLYSFLASRTKPNLRLGEAAAAGEWALDSPAFVQLKEFVHAL
jgi:hypothetical protein